MIFELIRRTKPALWPFFTQVATNFVFKISARYKLMMMRRRGTVYLEVKRYTIAMMVMLMLMTNIKPIALVRTIMILVLIMHVLL